MGLKELCLEIAKYHTQKDIRTYFNLSLNLINRVDDDNDSAAHQRRLWALEAILKDVKTERTIAEKAYEAYKLVSSKLGLKAKPLSSFRPISEQSYEQIQETPIGPVVQLEKKVEEKTGVIDKRDIERIIEEKLIPYESEKPKEIIQAIPLKIATSTEEAKRELGREIRGYADVSKQQAYPPGAKAQGQPEKFVEKSKLTVAAKPKISVTKEDKRGVTKHKLNLIEPFREAPKYLRRMAVTAVGTFVVTSALFSFILYTKYKDLKEIERKLGETERICKGLMEKRKIVRFAKELEGKFFYSDELEREYGIKLKAGQYSLDQLILFCNHPLKEEINTSLKNIKIKVLQREPKKIFSNPLRNAHTVPGSYFGAIGRTIGGEIDNHPHEGQDFDSNTDSIVYAAGDGLVVKVNEGYTRMEGYGKYIDIRHEHEGTFYTTRYAHNKRNLVQAGDSVKKGEPIAVIGTTGRSTGPHLHFEVHKNGIKRNPRFYLVQTAACDERENLISLKEFWEYVKGLDKNGQDF